jgi:hypothetical protein
MPSTMAAGMPTQVTPKDMARMLQMRAALAPGASGGSLQVEVEVDEGRMLMTAPEVSRLVDVQA